MVARDIRLAELTGGAVHFAHVSTAEALTLIRIAKAAGQAVTCDTAPPYFDLNETAIGDFRTYAKLSPPLRREQDRVAVIAALADGTIDAIASDHQPRDADDKRQPFALASAGGSGLATLLAITLAHVHNGSLALPAAIDLLTGRPAALLGIQDPDGSPRARSPICVCSIPTASGRSTLASCRARRRTRRSTGGRSRGSCWGHGSAACGCLADGSRRIADVPSDHGSMRNCRPERLRGAIRPDLSARLRGARRGLHALYGQSNSGTRRSDGPRMAGICRCRNQRQSAPKATRCSMRTAGG